jgi:integrase
MKNQLLTAKQTADLLSINEHTLNALVCSSQIPCVRLTSANGAPQLCFDAAAIVSWLKYGPQVKSENHVMFDRLKKQIRKNYSDSLAVLREYNRQFTEPRKPKGYSLSKVANKKLGFVFYVRYLVGGKLIPTRWSTHTNNYDAAVKFAVENRERLLAEYYSSRTHKCAPGKLYTIMRKYYDKNSPYLKTDELRGRTLADQSRHVYHSAIINHWIPYLKKYRIKSADEIDTPFMARFQDYCLGKGIKPQTINHYTSFISQIFSYMLIRGHIKSNPCVGLSPLKIKEGDCVMRGCYHINSLRGVFNKPWSDELSYLLCLVIYTTDMRNIEIDRIHVMDLIKIDQCWFIDIPKSKSKNGTRMVPLHPFVYNKLKAYIKKNNKTPGDLLFCRPNGKRLSRQRYTDANNALGKITGYDIARLRQENLTFYSGRHFWKTVMNAHGLGDVEEYFMGHKVSHDVAKRYNHRDKQGQEKIIEKAQEVFRILDNVLFSRSPRRTRAGKNDKP